MDTVNMLLDFVLVVLIFLFIILGIFIYHEVFDKDEMKDCLLIKKEIIGDSKHIICGKGCVTITDHYYNTTYDCNGIRKDRIEKAGS